MIVYTNRVIRVVHMMASANAMTQGGAAHTVNLREGTDFPWKTNQWLEGWDFEPTDISLSSGKRRGLQIELNHLANNWLYHATQIKLKLKVRWAFWVRSSPCAPALPQLMPWSQSICEDVEDFCLEAS